MSTITKCLNNLKEKEKKGYLKKICPQDKKKNVFKSTRSTKFN